MVQLSWEPTGVIRRFSGLVSADELDTSAKRLQGDVRTDDLHYIIHDFTDCTDITVTDNDIEFMAVRASCALQRNMKVKIAFVGTHPVVHKLMEAFNNNGLTHHRCYRFDTREEARRFSAARFNP